MDITGGAAFFESVVEEVLKSEYTDEDEAVYGGSDEDLFEKDYSGSEEEYLFDKEQADFSDEEKHAGSEDEDLFDEKQADSEDEDLFDEKQADSEDEDLFDELSESNDGQSEKEGSIEDVADLIKQKMLNYLSKNK